MLPERVARALLCSLHHTHWRTRFVEPGVGTVLGMYHIDVAERTLFFRFVQRVANEYKFYLPANWSHAIYLFLV